MKCFKFIFYTFEGYFVYIGYSENKSIAQYLLLVNEARAAVLVPRPPEVQNDSKLEAVVDLFLLGLTLQHCTHADSNLGGKRERPMIYKK